MDLTKEQKSDRVRRIKLDVAISWPGKEESVGDPGFAKTGGLRFDMRTRG
jgi:hypothetical protein